MTSGIPLGPYLLGRRLAVGGMAEIFLARRRDPAGLSGELVVKRILPHLAQDPQFSQMFFEEARIVSHLNHPNVVRFYDFGQADGSFYLAMELVRGVDLGDLVARATRRRALQGQTYALPPPHVAKMLSGVCDGLAHAHALVVNGERVGLVHRDITPANILLGFDGSVKIADFGVAKLARGAQRDATRVGRVRGKYAYLSPEQARGERLDARSDVFNVGILLFEAVLGEDLYPHDDKDKARLLAAAGRIPGAERIARMPPRLADLTRWALSPRRQERAGSAIELRDALDEYVRGAGVPTGAAALGAQVRALFPDRVAADARMPQAAGTGPHAALPTAPLTDPADGRVETPALGLPATPPVVFQGSPAMSHPAGPSSAPRASSAGPQAPALATSPWPGESALPTQVVARSRQKRRSRLGGKRGLVLLTLAAAGFGLAAFAFGSQGESPPGPLARPMPPPRPPPARATPPAPFELRLRAEPAGLSLRLDGRTLGPAPQLASTTPHTSHLVEALRDGRVVASQQTRGEAGQVRELLLRAPPDEATVRLVSTPTGARARVDGQEVGVTPITLTLASGVHRLELLADGYERLTTQLEAVTGRAGTVALALAEESRASRRRARRRTGVLSVQLRARHQRARGEASVRIDGAAPRALPLRGLRLPPGHHELTLEVTGRAPRHRSFRIRARRHTRLRY